MFKRYLLGCLSSLALAVTFTANATTVLPQPIDAITRDAALAFEGTCTGNRTELDPATNLIVTYTTFSVSEVLKGSAGPTYTIKQPGGELPGEKSGFRIQGVPTFTVGEQYVVFLAGVSRSGFSSPIGLSQGRFTVHDGPTGRLVSNGRDFREMAANIPEAELPPGLAQRLKGAGEPVNSFDLGDFKQLIRSRATGVNR